MVKTNEPKFQVGEFLKLKGIVDAEFIYEIENIYKFKDSICYGLKDYSYPYSEDLFESLDRNEKLEIIIKDNCKMIDILVAGLAQIIRKSKTQIGTDIPDIPKKKEDRYWNGFYDGQKSSLNHNIILMKSQLKSHKELRV